MKPVVFFADPATLPPLRRGRHKLPVEQVRRSQRERLLAGIIHTVGRYGYLYAQIGDFITAAGVSRKTYYELFTDKADGFREAVTVVGSTLAHALHSAASPSSTWAGAVIAAVDQLTCTTLAHPLVIRACLIDAPTVSATAPLLQKWGDAAATFLDRGRAAAPHPEFVAPNAPQAALGAMRQILLQGELTMRKDLVHAALDPFLGPAQTHTLLRATT